MALPVKTLILQAIVAALEGIATISTVRRNPSTQPKRETASFPVTCVYDDVESRVLSNRYAVCSFPVQIETYLLADDQDVSDAADLIDCEIYKAMQTDPGILALAAVRPEEGATSKKGYIDEFTGVLICRYVVTYRHAAKDPTDPVRII